VHGEEERVSADRGYDYPQIHAHLQQQLIENWIARKSKPKQRLDAWTRGLNHAIAKLRAIGEHPFRILKRQFGYTKARTVVSPKIPRNSSRCLRWATFIRSGERCWRQGRNPPGKRKIAGKPGGIWRK